MKRRKVIIQTTASVILTVLLGVSALADTPSTQISITDSTASTPGNAFSATPNVTSTTGGLPQGEPIPYPTDIQLMEQGARNYLYKTYTVAANYEPNLLVESPFSQGGYRYRFSEIIQRDSTPGSVSKTVTQTSTVASSTDNKAEILALFGDKLPYSDSDGYEGELFLIPESLTISESGQTSYSYTVSETKQFDNLDSNDMAYIPKTMVKNGMTLPLQDVDWQVTDSQSMGYSTVANKYTATAYYSAPATGTKASGYTATASFSGNVVKQMIGKNTYTIVYEGEQIVIPFDFVPVILAGVVVAGCIVAAILLWRMRKNVTIYTLQQGVPELYAKIRISPKNPVLDLSRLTDVAVRLVFDKQFVKALYDQKVFVIGRFTNYRINITGSLVQELPAQRNAEGAPGTEWAGLDEQDLISNGGNEE